MNAGEWVHAAAYLVGAAVLVHEARRRRLATGGMALVGVWGLVGGIVGARLAHWLVVEPALLVRHPVAFLTPGTGGRTILGGVAGGWLAVEIAKRRLGIRRSTGDGFALALAAGEAVGRLGCHLGGCCHGRVSAVPWAIWQHAAWRHPTQLYSAAYALVLYLALRAVRDRLRHEGELFGAYLVAFGLGRLVLECWRDDAAVALGLSAAQWAGLALAAAGAVRLVGLPRPGQPSSGGG